MRLRSAIALCVGVPIATFAAAPARADAMADAKDLFVKGRELRARGDCASALPLFLKAYDLFPSGLGSLRNAAECQESIGHVASARRAWLDLERALLANRDPKYDGWSADAEEASKRLAPRVATLTIDVSVTDARGRPQPSQDVGVRLNGEPLPPTLLGAAVDRDPGHYVVYASTPRAPTPQEQALDLTEGSSQRVVLHLTAAAAPVGSDVAAAPAAGAATPPQRNPTYGARRTGAWVAFGVAGAALVGTVASVVVRQSALDSLGNLRADGCTSNGGSWLCPKTVEASAQSAHDKGATASTLFNVFLPLSLVAAGAGVVLLATTREHAPEAAIVFSPVGASVEGRF